MQRRLIVYEFTSHEDFHSSLEDLRAQDILFRAYTPLPEDDIMEMRDVGTNKVILFAVLGAIIGFAGGFILQYYANVIGFPINIGGRPQNSWPAFMIICFELMILSSAIGIFSSIFILNRYPRFDRDIFGLPDFNERRDRHFFLTTQKEVNLDKAIKRFDLTPSE